MTRLAARLVRAMENHDVNEERRYLYEGRRWNLCWGWMWLSWGLGVHASVDIYGDECLSAWAELGPFGFEAYRKRKRP